MKHIHTHRRQKLQALDVKQGGPAVFTLASAYKNKIEREIKSRR
jgi:hypothetical protein